MPVPLSGETEVEGEEVGCDDCFGLDLIVGYGGVGVILDGILSFLPRGSIVSLRRGVVEDHIVSCTESRVKWDAEFLAMDKLVTLCLVRATFAN